MSERQLDAAADSTIAAINTVRREMEREHGPMLCDCGHPAHPRSCYCQACEDRIDAMAD